MMSDLRISRLCRQVAARQTVNPVAIALLLTEMRFRGTVFRLCEVFYAVWYLYIVGREPKVTLGISQVSFIYWRRRFGSNNPLLLKSVFDDFSNYEVCCAYLALCDQSKLSDVLTRYNGRPSRPYANLFFQNLTQVNSVIAKTRLGC
jgi:hypothetical protein